MGQSQGFVLTALKKVLFRQFIRNRRLQSMWSMLHTLVLYGMNYGGGGTIKTSGEEWVLCHFVGPGCADLEEPVIFDIGANIGEYSLCIMRHIPRARVYAFEPSSLVYSQLTQNLGKTNTEERVLPFRLGFSDTNRTVDLYSYAANGVEASVMSSVDLRRPTQVVDVKTKASEQIEVQTIDHFCASQGIRRIDFLKMDVEGHELAVLNGAARMLSSGSISTIQFEFGPTNIYSRTYFFDFWSLLSDKYDIYRILPLGIAPIGYYGEHREIFLNTNYLALQRKDTQRGF
jgi:FkbM family methyltransferase